MPGPYTVDKTKPADTDVISVFPTNERAMRSGLETDLTSIEDEKQVILKFAALADEKAAGTAGGTFTTGAARTRTLNTEIYDPDTIVSISANQFTLGAGTYIIEWSAPAYGVNAHQTFLYDVTGTAVVENGSSEYALNNAGGGNATGSRSMGYARVAPGSSNVYEIQHRCSFTLATNGFGLASGTNIEVYTLVKITQVA